jgi:hypothetical protein
MRPLAALASAILVGCGSGPGPRDLLPRYAVLTSFGPESPLHAAAEGFARLRGARMHRFQPGEVSELGRWLFQFDPTYVAIVLRPEELDANLHADFLELACRIDDDPFPDFTFGYLVAPDVDTLRRQTRTAEGADARVDPRIFRITRFEPGAEASSDATERLEWAKGLPVRRVRVKDGDAAYYRERRDALLQCDFLLLGGDGSPEGLLGLPHAEVELLRLDGIFVFSEAAYTGAAGAAYGDVGGTVRRRQVAPERSFAQTLIRAGAGPIFAPLDRSHPGTADFEWADVIQSAEPAGFAMKHAYDLAILSAGGKAPSLPRFAESRPAPRREGPLFFGTTRVLLGDPMFRPPVREHRPVLKSLPMKEFRNGRGETVLEIADQVAAWDCAPWFNDPHSPDRRLYSRVRLPRGARAAQVRLRSLTAQEAPVQARLGFWANEDWRGDSYLHILLHGKEIQREDLIAVYEVVLR